MVVSFDAGGHFIDYGRWQGYTVTAAACAGTTASLTLSSLTSAGGEVLTGAGQVVYVHDVGADYNGQFTLASAAAGVITYTVSTCVGAGTPSSGYVGLMNVGGSAPLGNLSGGYNMMFPVSGGANPFTIIKAINYGQDGSYPAGIESVCDPTLGFVYRVGSRFCSWDDSVPFLAGSLLVIPTTTSLALIRLSGRFILAADTSNGFLLSRLYVTARALEIGPVRWQVRPRLIYSWNAGNWPAEREAPIYFPTYHAYIMPGYTRDQSGGSNNRISWYWVPHPCGAVYPITESTCIEVNGSGLTPGICSPGFHSLFRFNNA